MPKRKFFICLLTYDFASKIFLPLVRDAVLWDPFEPAPSPSNSRNISPFVGSMSKYSILTSVDFPEPLSPTIPSTSFGKRSKDMSLHAVMEPHAGHLFPANPEPSSRQVLQPLPNIFVMFLAFKMGLTIFHLFAVCFFAVARV